MHPAAGLILERVVPPQGIDILGKFIPGGTIVGQNPWVLHRRSEIFGDDVDQFRPERWLEASSSRLSQMKATMFQFGAGARTCIGKNISMLEMSVLFVSTVLMGVLTKEPLLGTSSFRPFCGTLRSKWWSRKLSKHTTHGVLCHRTYDRADVLYRFVRQLNFNTRFKQRKGTHAE